MSQDWKFAFKIFLKTLPSIKCDEIISCGPAKIPIQAVSAIPFNFALIGFINIWPNAHVKAPANTKAIPMYLPSKLGDPDKIINPINAIIIPKIFLICGFSFKKI